MSIHRMKRRAFIAGLGGAVTWPVMARAQHPAIPVIGFINGASPEGWVRQLAAFRQGLRETGYVEERNTRIEYRWAQNHYDRLPGMVTDLILNKVLAIAAASVDAAHAAKAATSNIPIIFSISGDPVTEGLVTSLNQPGGNLTGVTTFSGVLTSKRLELLHELVPTANVAVLINPNNSNAKFRLKEVDEASRTLALPVQVVNASGEDDIDAIFASFLQRGVSALLIVDDPLFSSHRAKLVALEAGYRIPTIYFQSEFVKAGGLISYASDYADGGHQLGIYTGQVLRGVKPTELPVFQPTTFELVINLKTARALDITVPPSLLARADEVIE
jgi:putative ABC transport system substrate-binding protein